MENSNGHRKIIKLTLSQCEIKIVIAIMFFIFLRKKEGGKEKNQKKGKRKNNL
jgi:hypothetical protein